MEPIRLRGCRGLMPIKYQTYKNTDTPALAALWNEAASARGCAVVTKPSVLETHLFAKPWFDPKGIILGVDSAGNKVVGTVIAGFGASDNDQKVDPTRGVVALLMVHPDHRRKGIGRGLLQEAERYLVDRGTRDARVGTTWERTPYGWGIVGSSRPTGVLQSTAGAHEFLTACGYKQSEHYLVLDRDMARTVPLGDPRFPTLRRKYELRVGPRRVTTWLDEALQGAHESVVFELLELAIAKPVGELRAWDMGLFAVRTKVPQAGLYGFQIKEELRGQGLGKYLLCQSLQHLQEQMYGRTEVVIPAEREGAKRLFESVGFVWVDEGWSYAKELNK
jgi:ribosomal protein S18 acetylase RimI-like enzyme